MALTKTLYTSTGVETTYHRINGIHDYSKNEIPTVHIEVESYVSCVAKENGSFPSEINQYEFAGQDYPFSLDGMSKQEAYWAIKTIKRFSHSIDI